MVCWRVCRPRRGGGGWTLLGTASLRGGRRAGHLAAHTDSSLCETCPEAPGRQGRGAGHAAHTAARGGGGAAAPAGRGGQGAACCSQSPPSVCPPRARLTGKNNTGCTVAPKTSPSTRSLRSFPGLSGLRLAHPSTLLLTRRCSAALVLLTQAGGSPHRAFPLAASSAWGHGSPDILAPCSPCPRRSIL